MEEKLWHIHYANANSRETYYSIHHVKEAHKYGKGKNIKVGIIDWCFGLNKYPDLYSGGIDVANGLPCLNESAEHGYWMACALHEIAPECLIYAINCFNGNNFETRVEYIMKALNWAMENSIDILTFSHMAFNNEERLVIDKAIDLATSKGIITTFIHYPYEKNIYPRPLFRSGDEKREPDIRILHYDYNTLFINTYEKYISMNKMELKSGNDIPFFSISSTSPVLAGFIAIMKSIDKSLTADECKKILRQTSYSTHFTGYAAFDDVDIDNVADIGNAAKLVFQNKMKHQN